MRFPARCVAITAGLAFFVGCGDREIGQPPTMTVTGSYTNANSAGNSTRASAVHYLYATNYGGNNSGLEGTVSVYAMNEKNGALKQIKGSPFSAGYRSIGIAIDATGGFAFVANDYDNQYGDSVSAYAISSHNGSLTQVKGSPFAASHRPHGVATDPTGKYVYVTNLGQSNTSGGSVSAYTIDATSGALTQIKGSPFTAGLEPNAIAVDPSGKYAYVANYGDYPSGSNGSISAYAIGAGGSLKQVKGSPFAPGGGPEGVTIGSTGKFVYVTDGASNDVSVYAIDAKSGALSQISGSPYAAGAYRKSVAIDPTGRFAYVTNTCEYVLGSCQTGTISAYAINAKSGALTPVAGSPFSAGFQPYGLAINPNGKFIYVTLICATASCETGGIAVYAVNAKSGALKLAKGPFKTGLAPQQIAIR